MSNHAHAHEHGPILTPWPLVISIGILAMIPLAFIFKFSYHNSFAAILSLGIGAPLCIIGVIGWVREAIGGDELSQGLGFGAMGWFILAEALIFLPGFATYWVLRLSAESWPPPGSVDMPQLMPVIMTVVLVSSSLTIHKAEGLLEAGDVAGFRKWLAATMLLGLSFLLMSIYEWNHLFHLGFTIDVNVFSSSFFSLTGLHGSHVFVGLGIFLAIMIPAMSGKINHTFVRTGSLYWHFVDIIWFFVVSQLYFW
ncbi:MAG TPA: heme-copper oxidase subunit III [Gammaproteobacteria bacterium]|nr:heme-copper oxidase subunit III [Gammaproteobacteria bacterium]